MNGSHPIAIRIIKDRKAKFVFTGKSAKKEQWDEVMGLPNKKHPLHKELTIYLKKKLLDADTELLQLEKDDTFFTADNIKQTLKTTKSTKTIFEYFDSTILELEKNGQVSSRSKYITARNRLLDFTKGNRDIDPKAIDLSFLLRYEKFLRLNNYKTSSIATYFTPLNTIINILINDKLIKKDASPFLNFSLRRFKYQPNHRAMDKTKMQSLLCYKTKEGSIEEFAIHYFTFSYYCWGMNMADIARLKWKDIHDSRLVYIRSKTKKQYNIPILPPVQMVLDHYKRNSKPHPEDYIFPILDDQKYKNQKRKIGRINYQLKKINKALTKIAYLNGINESVTSYMARHSFATNLRNMDISTSKIQHMLGHSTAEMTQGYLDSFKNNELDEAAMVLLD